MKKTIDYIRASNEYDAIKSFYGDKITNRSGVPLMNHIDEGIEIMVGRGASERAILAYTIHPIFQGDSAFTDIMNFENWHTYNINHIERPIIIRVMEYRRAANAYLCKPSTDNWAIDDMKEAIGLLLPDIREMLIADKIQNQRDFLKYHYGTHTRSKELDQYFKNWLEILEV